MKELIEALGPYPLVQGFVIAMIVVGFGIYAFQRGMKRPPQLEEMKARWELFNHIAEMHENSKAQVKLLERLNEGQLLLMAAVNRINDMRWDRHQ